MERFEKGQVVYRYSKFTERVHTLTITGFINLTMLDCHDEATGHQLMIQKDYVSTTPEKAKLHEIEDIFKQRQEIKEKIRKLSEEDEELVEHFYKVLALADMGT